MFPVLIRIINFITKFALKMANK